jgi:hypothetical protein
MKNIFIFCSLLLGMNSLAQAGTRIAFLEVYDYRGKLVQYEPGSRFGHTAIQVGDLWLQSYPGEGVKLISLKELKKRGTIAEILELPIHLTNADFFFYLGRPFDFGYTWGDEAFYCSELLAKILDVQPEPMQLNREVWPENYWPLEGQPGMSPDKLYRVIRGPGPYYRK